MSDGEIRRRGLEALLESGLGQGLYSGAAAGLVTPAGRVVFWTGTHAHDDDRRVGADSLFDLASVSKTFTAAAIVRLAELGRVDLDAPVAGVLPVGSGQGAETVTLRMLLTHVSGLPAESALWRDRGIPFAERMSRVLATPLESMPGAVHRYSCVGYVAAGAIAERWTGSTLPSLLDELVTGPLGLSSVGYGPVARADAVATEDEPWVDRGVVRGEVHDELNWFLGGRVGNAGLFGAVGDVLTFAESFLDERLLGAEALRSMTTDALAPGLGAEYGQALGPRVRDRALFGEVDAFGHAGFTGTLWFAAPAQGVAGVLLTNRVHPGRSRVDLAPFQRDFVAAAMAAADPDAR